MTQDEIIEMAMKCGASKEKAKTNADIFEAFAKLVAQRTWVGLTDKDWKRNKHSADFQKGVDWAEAILKARNT